MTRQALAKIMDWENQCYNCGRVFRNYNNRFSTHVPRKQKLINVCQKFKIKVFCSEECKLEYIYLLQQRG